jgi:hypothetical protein
MKSAPISEAGKDKNGKQVLLYKLCFQSFHKIYTPSESKATFNKRFSPKEGASPIKTKP